MRHLIVAAHPRSRSFTLSMARTYVRTVEALGHSAQLRDLYRLGFDPCLSEGELPWSPDFAAGEEVTRERDLVAEADVVVLVYPLWFNAEPAILEGYVDRVFGFGFGFSEHHIGGNEPLLGEKKLVSFTCSGAPQRWVESSGAWEAMQAHFDRHIAAVTGMALIGHHNLGGIVPDLDKDIVARRLGEIEWHARAIAAAYA